LATRASLRQPAPAATDSGIVRFATLRNQGLVSDHDPRYLRVERHLLAELMRFRIAAIAFDESWYLNTYPDVRDAVARGDVASGHAHYLKAGYFENRMPHAIRVAEAWYLNAYPDVADALRKKLYPSGQAHFEQVGFREGRLPYANFTL
jgi:hypothetical protein